MSKRIIFFDGVCNFCDSFINFLIKNEKDEANLFYSTLQSENGIKFLNNEKNSNEKLETIFFVNEKGEVFIKGKAFFEIFRYLNFPFSSISILKFLPSIFLNLFYDLFAKNRYKLFGKKSECEIPSEKIRKKFI